MEDLFTVTQVARSIGVAPNTVRVYTREYPDHLSDHATPARGQERKYTEADIATLQTVRILRQQRRDYESIDSFLAEGQRIEPAESVDTPPDAEKTPKTEDTTALATVDLLDRFIVRYEERIDTLEEQLDAANKDLLEAKVEAAQLRGKLEERDRPPRWQFWRRVNDDSTKR